MRQFDTNPLKLYKTRDGYERIQRWYDKLADSIAVPHQSHYVNTRFGRTHALVTGSADAPPVLLVQGVSGSAPLWRRQLVDLAPHFRVIALDTPGQPGRSAPNVISYTGDDHVHWLCDVLDSFSIARAHIAGVSAAGWTALRMGVIATERVRKIVMLSPTGLARARLPIKIWLTNVVSKRKDADALEDSLTARSFSTESPADGFDRQLARAMALATRHYRVDLSLDMVDEARGKIALGQAARVLGVFFLPQSNKALRAFQAPGLLVLGEHERLYSAKRAAKRVRKLMPTVETEIIPDAGHAALYDRPEIVNPLIIDYLLRPSFMA